MVKTISMQEIRYLNLFEQVTKVRTRFCFKYNEIIFFCVPRDLVSKAIGERGRNIKKMSEILKKNIRVIPVPRGLQDAESFIRSIISPLTVRYFQINSDEIVAACGKNKAALIGRNKRRLLEMQKIVSDFFDKEFRIV